MSATDLARAQAVHVTAQAQPRVLILKHEEGLSPAFLVLSTQITSHPSLPSLSLP